MAGTCLRHRAARLAAREPAPSDEWISECVSDLERNNGAAALLFIVFARERIHSAEMLAVYAAGPLENVRGCCGSEIIEAAGGLARPRPKFRLMHSGIWGRNRIAPEIRERICIAVAAGSVFSDDFRTPGHQSGRPQASDAIIAAPLETSVVDDLGGRAAVITFADRAIRADMCAWMRLNKSRPAGAPSRNDDALAVHTRGRPDLRGCGRAPASDRDRGKIACANRREFSDRGCRRRDRMRISWH